MLFLIGAIVMRGAGCTWNDLVDRDIDAQVERTRSRPIPSGQVSVRAAAVFLVAQALVGLLVLLQFNRFTIWLGIASLGGGGDLSVHEARDLLAADLPRPRLLLGRADGLGRRVRPARSGRRSLLYAGSIAWVIHYDTIYAHQDREDDALVGLKSTALLFGERTRPALAVFSTAGGGADRACRLWRRRRACVRARAGGVRRSPRLADRAHRYRRSGRSCLRLFKSNRDAGLILFAALILDAD